MTITRLIKSAIKSPTRRIRAVAPSRTDEPDEASGKTSANNRAALTRARGRAERVDNVPEDGTAIFLHGRNADFRL